MNVLAIDPGNEKSAYVVFDGVTVSALGILPNDEILERIWGTITHDHVLAIEGVACYGMPVGKEIFDTCIWIGRFMERFGADRTYLIYRGEVKMHLCGSMRAKDPSIRQALLDRFGPSKAVAVGTKRQPGPLYGIKSHCWSALSVGVTWWDTRRVEQC